MEKTILNGDILTDPDRINTILDVFTKAPSEERMMSSFDEISSNYPLGKCLLAIRPLLQSGLTIIQEGIESLQKQYAALPFDSEQLSRSFLKEIAPELLFQMGKPVILEMHIAGLEGRLQGETPEDRFAHFMRLLSQKGEIMPLLSSYPVLAHQLAITIDQWAGAVREFLEHLCADWPAICAVFSPENDPGLLVDVQAGMGDRHRRGRSVLLLRFESGMRLLYKPKPLAVDVHFQDLLAWLNEQGADPPLRLLKLIDSGEYGWSEFVAATACNSPDEVERFYERQGSYLALLYVLNAVDLHNENVIAAGEHPMLVDLEALFHPRVEGIDPTQLSNNLASRAMDQSVWQVGLLPRRLWSDEESPGVDMSGLGGQAGQKMPHPLARWENTGSDQMRLVRQRVEMPVSQNRPRLDDRDVNVLDYKDAIIAGFTKMYRLLCRQREILLDNLLPRFTRDEIRVVLRSTRIYGTLLYESYHPDLLRDARERDHFFDQLSDEVKQPPYLTRLLPAERRDLLRGDIPVFTTYPGSRSIFTSEREELADFFDTPSLERARQQIRQLGEKDLKRQLWIIEASLATLRMGHEDASERPLPVRPAPTPVSREKLLALAQAVGKRIEELAFQNEAGAHWLGVNYVDENIWSLFPTGMDLYNGGSGITLFLSYLGWVTGDASFTRLARRSLASTLAQVKEQKKLSMETSIGAFDGLGSPIYLLAHLGALWNDPALFQEAEELVEWLPELISKDQHRDIINGAAGCILSLLSLCTMYPAAHILEIAILCGDHLLACAQTMPKGIAWETLQGELPLGGFSHGTAGIAYSLLRLAESSGEERFRETALSALEYDRSLFLPEQQNWADLRVFPSRKADAEQPDERIPEASRKSMVAWCHGAPGIGLGRLGTLDQLNNARVREEIDIALNTTIRSGFAGNHSLCHGALGNAELLLAAAQLLDRQQDREALERAKAQILGSIEGNGWVSAVPLGVETPGLMTGLAGIGYELLRLAEPGKVPSVLLLAPPVLS